MYFLDANVLYSTILTDFFLSAHELGLIRIVWSTYVEQEAERSLLRDIATASARTAIAARFASMRVFAESFDSSLRLQSRLETKAPVTLPDTKDEPVLVDALEAGADTLVTANLKDFPIASLHETGLSVVSPDDLIVILFKREPQSIEDVLNILVAKRTSPPVDRSYIVGRLEKAGCKRSATLLLGATLA